MTLAVLHVAETLKGGTASYLEEILPHQKSVLGRARVAMLVPQSQIAELPSAVDLPLSTFDDRGGRAQHVLLLIAALRHLLKFTRPAIVHAHGTFAGVAARIALRGLRHPPKLVYCAHGWAFDRDGAHWKNAAIARIEALLAHWTDAVICISQHDFDTAVAAGLSPHKLIAIPNGIRGYIPIDEEVAWPPGRCRFVFVGRFDRQKGADIFAAALRQLGDGAFAYLVGSPVLRGAAAIDLPPNAQATGWLPRASAQAYLRSADVVVVPSRWEGFGLSALEAMRAGKAVIASRVGGLPELVVHGVTGLLVEPNSPTALAAAMASGSTEQWMRMGAAGYARFKACYSAERMNTQILDLYSALLKGVVDIHSSLQVDGGSSVS